MKRLLALAALLLGLSIAAANWLDGPPGETEQAYHDLYEGD